jgi:hypothetical protein
MPFAITGPNANHFSQTNDCPVAPMTLAVNALCTITLTYTPDPSGIMEAATLNISDDARPFNTPTGSVQMVALSGTGIPPMLTFAPPAATGLSFGSVTQGQPSSPMMLRVNVNPNFGAWFVGGISVNPTGAGTQANDFMPQSNTCGVRVNPDNSCTITVIFTPSIVAAESADLVLAGNQAGSPTRIPMTGTGLMPTTTFVSLTPMPGTGTQVTIVPGQTGQFTLVLTVGAGSTGTATFTCGPPIPTTICTVTPSSASLNGVTTVTLTVTFRTNCFTGQMPPGPMNWPPGLPPQLAVLWLAALLGLGLVRRFAPQTRMARVAPALLMLLLVMTWAGCTTGSSAINVQGQPQTPPGLYTITITGSSGGAQSNIQLFVRVI